MLDEIQQYVQGKTYLDESRRDFLKRHSSTYSRLDGRGAPWSKQIPRASSWYDGVTFDDDFNRVKFDDFNRNLVALSAYQANGGVNMRHWQ